MLRVFFDPGVVEPHMIRDKIEHQSQTAPAEPFAKPGQRGIAAEILVNVIGGDRETGPGDVLFAQVRQRLLELAAPLGIRTRDLLRTQASLPDAEEPDPVETHLDQTIQFSVGYIIERGGAPQLPGQFGQPDACVDLIEQRITRGAHEFWLILSAFRSS